MNELSDRLNHATQFARQAGESTLKLFRSSGLEVDRKGDDSPVTEADRGAEQLLRKLIGERFPGDGIVGEEFDDKRGDSGFTWVLDPIDGTKSFIHGVPLYTTLVAVLRDAGEDEPGESVVGVIFAPATGEMVSAATGQGCWYQAGAGEPIRAKVSETESLASGLLLTSELASFQTHRQIDATPAYLDLQQQARLARTWGDGYGYLMVATGRAEAMIDPVLNLWDIAPMLPILEEAGGRLTNWRGERTVHGGDAIATNGRLHDEILAQTRDF